VARTIAIDFDGVIHTYKGWRKGFLDVPIPGILEFIKMLQERGAEVVVFTTREVADVQNWLELYDFPVLRITNEKLKEFSVFIDDRAVVFHPAFVAQVTGREQYVNAIMHFEPHWRDD